jgi:oxygen-independent coproporphyrinogen-3 oxidase
MAKRGTRIGAWKGARAFRGIAQATTPHTVKQHAAPVPRYTSYPTAPNFTPLIGAERYARWLAALAPQSALSLYVHIPFCTELCWYCGCTTKATRRYEPVADYLEVLLAEITSVARRAAAEHRIAHIHLGGGSPCILTPTDVARLVEAIRGAFGVAPNAEWAIEIDPRRLDPARAEALACAGFNRVSIGVQDFDPKVQAAINRIQSQEATARAVTLLRAIGIKSINIDLVYGLPHQTRDGTERTIEKVIALSPDRIALFGYAHLPARLPHQRLIDEAALPGAVERFAQMSRAASRLTEVGYRRIGLDHFALPHDPLATGVLRRKFQGYTTDAAETLIGLGASANGRLAGGYVQNAAPVDDYARRIRQDGLATVRGVELSLDDRVRGFAIERLMCDLRFPAAELAERFGPAADEVVAEAGALLEADTDGLVVADRSAPGFLVTEKGRPFLRSICACFDRYFTAGSTSRHAVGVLSAWTFDLRAMTRPGAGRIHRPPPSLARPV